MKKFSYIIICLLSLMLIPVAQATEQEIFQLKNGLTVLLVEDHRFPLVSTRLFVHTGAAFEETKYKGISHLLEHMVFNGTQNRPLGQLEKELYAAGGSYNAYTSYDQTAYLVTLPSKNWELSLDVVADMTFHPLLEPKLLDKEKIVVKSEMSMRKDNQQNQLFTTLSSLALKNTPYEIDVIGSEESLDNVSLKVLNEYRTTYYNPQNMLLIMAGDITKKEVLPTIEKIFGSYTNMHNLEQVKRIDPFVLNYGVQTQVIEGAWQKALLGIALPGASVYDEKRYALDILTYLLGSTSNSFFTKDLQFDKQLVDLFNMGNMNYERIGLIYGMALLDPENLSETWAEFTKKLATLSADSFTDEEIEQAKFLYENMYSRSKETLDSIAESTGSRALFQPNLTEEDEIFAIRSVHRKDIQDAIDMWINPENMSIVALVPTGTVESKLIPDFEKTIKKYWQTEVETTKVAPEEEADIVIKLAEGSQVVLEHDKTMPFFHAQLVIAGGDVLLKPEEEGLATALANMLTKSTLTLERAEKEKAFLDKASFMQVNAGRESLVIDFSGPVQFQKEIFDLVKLSLTEPAFNEKDWDLTKQLLLASIKSSDDNALSYLFRRVSPSLFEGNAYGYYNNGTLKSVEGFSLNQVIDLWEKQKNQAWTLTVIGDFSNKIAMDFAAALPIINKPFTLLDAPQWKPEKRVDFNLADKNQAHVLQIFPAVPREHKDAPALTVLYSLLGDMSGILFTEFRINQQLAYSVNPQLAQWPSTGYISYYIGTEPQHLDKIEPSFNKISKNLQTQLIENERIEAAKNNIQSQYIQSKQPLAERASEININLRNKRSLDFEEQFMEKVQDVTARDIQRVAQEYLNPENSYIFRVLPMN